MHLFKPDTYLQYLTLFKVFSVTLWVIVNANKKWVWPQINIGSNKTARPILCTLKQVEHNCTKVQYKSATAEANFHMKYISKKPGSLGQTAN